MWFPSEPVRLLAGVKRVKEGLLLGVDSVREYAWHSLQPTGQTLRELDP